MSGIVELLKAFDRKERAWLVRMALKPAALDQGFLDRVSQALPSKPPLSSDAWWGMDYHIDWLVAALHAFESGLSVAQLTDIKDVNIGGRSKPIIEDFDFIIANEERIILIEAKAFGGWGTKQLKSKLRRLKQLEKPEKSEKPEELRMISKEGVVARHATAKCPLPKTVQLHLVLTSITESLPKNLTDAAPTWTLQDGKPVHIKLDIEPGQFMRVARSDKDGKISKNGTLWKIARDRSIKEG